MDTEVFILNTDIQVVFKFKLTNIGDETQSLKVAPQMVCYINEAQMAPWDKYQWYLYTTYKKEDYVTFASKLLSRNANSEKRRCGYLISNAEDVTALEVTIEKYEGTSDMYHPHMNYTNDDFIYGYPPIHALSYDWTLAPGQAK